ncbi:hypothetical protein PFISCL1PPCAC_18552, partial [Pristionchus fissidentatus]
ASTSTPSTTPARPTTISPSSSWPPLLPSETTSSPCACPLLTMPRSGSPTCFGLPDGEAPLKWVRAPANFARLTCPLSTCPPARRSTPK